MSVDWSQLPPELLETIAKKLKIYVDYLRFRAVCHNWRSSVLKTPNHLPCQIPWLFLPQPHSHQTHKLHRRRAFFSLSENKFHFLNLPEPSHCKRLCGSSHGWLVILDETPTISLINAITDAKLYLPPLSTFPNVSDLNFSKIGREYTLRTFTGDLVTHNLREMRDVFIKKVVLSSSPSNSGDFIAVAILHQTGDLAYCRKGDQSWSFINDTQFCCEDVVYIEGLFYAVNIYGTVAACDLSGPSPRVMIIQTPAQLCDDMQYLVNSGEDLLMVTRYLDVESDAEPDQPDILYKTTAFHVFRLNSSGPRWEKVESLGDGALFLGQNSSLCLSALDFPGRKGNCIYFTDEYSESNYIGGLGDHDIGIFNFGDGSIEPLPCYPRKLHSRFDRPPPIWVTPNPC